MMNDEEIEIMIEAKLLAQEKVLQGELDAMEAKIKEQDEFLDKYAKELDKLEKQIKDLKKWKKDHSLSTNAHRI